MSAPALAQSKGAASSRWVALAFVAVAQLMIALDATIVSIALPSAQAALRFSDADRQWVITAYTLAFGGLLLLGGRVADNVGRKRAFLAGLVGFALASVIAGAAPTFAVLVAARAAQGVFAAVLAPTALSLIAVSFTEPKERATAFAVYGSIAGSGAVVGLLLGGALTDT
jgi:MFS family permease